MGRRVEELVGGREGGGGGRREGERGEDEEEDEEGEGGLAFSAEETAEQTRRYVDMVLPPFLPPSFLPSLSPSFFPLVKRGACKVWGKPPTHPFPPPPLPSSLPPSHARALVRLEAAREEAQREINHLRQEVGLGEEEVQGLLLELEKERERSEGLR